MVKKVVRVCMPSCHTRSIHDRFQCFLGFRSAGKLPHYSSPRPYLDHRHTRGGYISKDQTEMLDPFGDSSACNSRLAVIFFACVVKFVSKKHIDSIKPEVYENILHCRVASWRSLPLSLQKITVCTVRCGFKRLSLTMGFKPDNSF